MAEIQNIIELTFTEADGSAFAASALESANNAAESATNAFRYASTASDSADASAESARLSNQFAVNAYDRASAALRAKEGAETAAQQAETSATNAATYEQNAFANAQDAQFQANRAATASQTAVRNASDAAGYAANASSAANNASNSATSAASSATQATSAKDTVVASVTEAAGYASSADSSATQAAQSAATAQTQAQNAMTHASNAQTFANNAQTSATQAAGYATTANDSANIAVEVAESIPSDYTTLSNDVDDLKSAKADIMTSSAYGAVANLTYGANDLPVLSLSFDINLVQSGSGDPSPTNIRLISGWTGASLKHSGADISDYDEITIDWSASAGTVYGGNLNVTTGVLTVTKASVDLGSKTWTKNSIAQGTMFRTTIADINPIINSGYIINAICEKYKAVKQANRANYTMSTGTGTGKRNIDIIDNNYSDAASFKTAVTGTKLVYELETAITYQLTPQEVKTLLGVNNIWSNTGNTTVAYRCDTRLGVENAIDMVGASDMVAHKYSEPQLVSRDSLNRYSTIADMLLTSKRDCIYHDNFNRSDSVDSIGYNFVTGSYGDEYDIYFPVGIYNNNAYSTNPDGVVGSRHFKLIDAEKLPYLVDFAVPDAYSGTIAIDYSATKSNILIQVLGSADNRYIKVNYNGVRAEESLYDEYRKFTTVSVLVYQTGFTLYLDGRYFKTIEYPITSSVCGMMFNTDTDMRYKWFSVSYLTEFSEIGFDSVIEDYGLIGKGYVAETGNANGITANTSVKIDSYKSIKFILNHDDTLAEGSKRSEVGIKQNKKHNLSNKVYSFDMYFGSDYDYDSTYEIIFQLHTFADDDNYAGLAPSTALQVQKNKVTIVTRGQADKAVDGSGSTVTSQELFTIIKEQWYHFVIYQREAYERSMNPLTMCFVDGELKFYSEEINAYNADNGTYPKFGIYKTPWVTQTSETNERSLYVDNFKMWY